MTWILFTLLNSQLRFDKAGRSQAGKRVRKVAGSGGAGQAVLLRWLFFGVG